MHKYYRNTIANLTNNADVLLEVCSLACTGQNQMKPVVPVEVERGQPLFAAILDESRV